MCGICGYISKTKYNESLLIGMNDTMIHRGPDDSGTYQAMIDAEYHMGIAQRRLSILDLSALGHQPMFNTDRTISIVYNGEIYNFEELRDTLQKKGYYFSSHCDTEVILAAYQEYGEAFVNKLNGMFAICICDYRQEKVLLLRDRIGKKPLYYHTDADGTLIFGSELKPLMKHPLFHKNIRKEIISRYLSYKYINAPDTIFENTYKVMPGEYLVWKKGQIYKHRYWELAERYEACVADPITSYTDAKEQLTKLLYDSVEKRLLSDVPVGTFLSGGYDSTLLSAIAGEVTSKPIKTFTIGFHQAEYNEAVYAKEIAQYLGTDHTELYVAEKELYEMIHDLPLYYDEPFADSSQIPMMLVSKLAKQDATVILSGDGGDELFCGYTLYDWVKWAQKLDGIGGCANWILQSPLFKPLGLTGRLPDKIAALIQNRDPATKVQLFTDIRQRHTEDMVLGGSISAKYEEEQEIRTSNWQIKRMLLDMMTDLPGDMLTKVDRAAMKYSLEVRCPLLDYRIVELSFRMQHSYKYHRGVKKYILKDITHDRVPKTLLDRPKKGFGVPLAAWMRHELHPDLLRYADKDILEKQEIFNPNKIQEFITALDKSDKSLYNSVLWSFYVFQMWYQTYIEDLWNK